jgi:hypothetical protein
MSVSKDRSSSTNPASPPPEHACGTEPEYHTAQGFASSESRPFPPQGVDRKTGRAIPISDSEWQERLTALEHELAEIDARDDTPDEAYEQFLRNIDEERCREGRPPAFQGYH